MISKGMKRSLSCRNLISLGEASSHGNESDEISSLHNVKEEYIIPSMKRVKKQRISSSPSSIYLKNSNKNDDQLFSLWPILDEFPKDVDVFEDREFMEAFPRTSTNQLSHEKKLMSTQCIYPSRTSSNSLFSSKNDLTSASSLNDTYSSTLASPATAMLDKQKKASSNNISLLSRQLKEQEVETTFIEGHVRSITPDENIGYSPRNSSFPMDDGVFSNKCFFSDEPPTLLSKQPLLRNHSKVQNHDDLNHTSMVPSVSPNCFNVHKSPSPLSDVVVHQIAHEMSRIQMLNQ